MNGAISLARASYDTILVWYHQGMIGQVEYEAWLAARDMLRPGGDGTPSAIWLPDTMKLAELIVAQWKEDHK